MFDSHIADLLELNINVNTAVKEAAKLEILGDAAQGISLINEVLYNRKWNPVIDLGDKLMLSILAPEIAANFNLTEPDSDLHKLLAKVIRLEAVAKDPTTALMFFKNELVPMLVKESDVDEFNDKLLNYSDVLRDFCPKLYTICHRFPGKYKLISSQNRRSLEVRGNVKFPTGNPRYKSTNEGGMLVRLVVLDPYYSYMVCSGGFNPISMDESFIGDDQLCLCQLCRTGEFTIESRRCDKFSHTFPRFDLPRDDNDYYNHSRYESILYLAVLTLGSTGWSGWDVIDEKLWVCTYEDLTEQGKGLYNSLALAYPDQKLILQTWLDT